jgi:hypothetical protein
VVDNQHKRITGYRDLTLEEIELINAVKETAENVRRVVDIVCDVPGIDKRWASIARTDLQTGFMALVRSIAKPDTF